MDVLNFIDSEEIREKLKKSGYKFSTLEAAYIIYSSIKATLTEKHEAWEELIKSMPDYKIPIDENIPEYKSIHTLLRKHIDMENELLSNSINAENSIYTIESNAVFSSYESCINDRKTDMFRKKQEYYYCRRLEIDNPYKSDYLFLNKDFEISNTHFEIDSYEEDFLEYAFDDKYFLDFDRRFIDRTPTKKPKGEEEK